MGINAIGNNENVEIQIDDNFYKENSKKIEKKIKKINPSFEVNFVKKALSNKIYEFNQDLINKVKNNTRENIEKNKTEDLNTEKSYRRKIKKKIVEKKD